MASKYQRIIAVEPDYKNYKKLQRWLLESGLANVEIIPKGIWDNVGELSFNNSGGRASALDLDGSTIITVDTVDNILQGDAATLIKMDVEGAEDVIFSENIMWIDRTSAIVMEVHEEIAPGVSERIDRIMTEKGFLSSKFGENIFYFRSNA